MGGVQSSSLRNTAQGESAGERPRERTDTFSELAGLIPVPVLTQVTPGADPSVVFYRLNSRDMKFRRTIIISLRAFEYNDFFPFPLPLC